MTSLLYLWNRISRMPRTRGFGIQSPTVYRFVRTVVNDRSAYNIYKVRARELASMSPEQRQTARLLFRMAVSMQPLEWLMLSQEGNIYAPFIAAGSEKTKISEIQILPLCLPTEGRVGVWLSAKAIDESQREQLLAWNNPAKVLVVDDIRASRQARQCWQALVNDARTGVAIDLYHCGLLFFDRQTERKCYRVNLPR